MRRHSPSKCSPAGVVLALLALPGLAWGSGAILYELGTPDVGLAAAGWSARADDASILFRNPAGMGFLGRSEVQLTAQLLYADLEFDPDAATTVAGGDGGNPIGVFPGGAAFLVLDLPLNLSAGVGMFSYFGLAQDFESDWVGRYYVQDSTLIGLTFMPSLSWRPFPWLSVGAGLNAMLGVYSFESAVNNVLGPDGSLEIDDTTWGFGADVGALVEPIEGTRIGVTYLSEVDLDFKDTPDFEDLGPGIEAALGAAGLLGSRLDLGLNVPQTVMVSVQQDLGERWSVLANFGWQDWSDFGLVEVTVNSATPSSLTFDRSYRDTYHGALGARFRPRPEWLLSAGFAYDSSAVSDSDRTVDFATGEMFRFGLGVQWQAMEPVQLGLAYELGWQPDMPVDQERGPLAGRVSGDFPDSFLHFFAFNVSYRI